eukprot:gene7389-biopygen10570
MPTEDLSPNISLIAAVTPCGAALVCVGGSDATVNTLPLLLAPPRKAERTNCEWCQGLCVCSVAMARTQAAKCMLDCTTSSLKDSPSQWKWPCLSKVLPPTPAASCAVRLHTAPRPLLGWCCYNPGGVLNVGVGVGPGK